MGPLISVVVACKNEEKDIEDCIKSLVNQTLTTSEYEIIFVDGNSADNTRKIIRKYMKKFKNIKLFIEKPAISPANARNIGVKKSKGKFIVFVDADNVSTKDYLASVLEGFKKLRADAIATKTLPITKSLLGMLMYHERLASDYIALKDHKKFFPNAFKKEVFLSLKGFNVKLGYGEDYDLHERLLEGKYRLVFYPKAKIYHKEPSTIQELYKESMWWGRTIPSLVKKHPIQFLRLGAILLRASLPIWIILIFIPKLSIFGMLLTFIVVIELSRYVIRSIKAGGKIRFALLLPFYKILKSILLTIGILSLLVKR